MGSISTALGVYVLGGAMYGRRLDPDKTIGDAHPHTAAWQEIPGLLRDGVRFSRQGLADAGLSFLQPARDDFEDIEAEQLVDTSTALVQPKSSCDQNEKLPTSKKSSKAKRPKKPRAKKASSSAKPKPPASVQDRVKQINEKEPLE